MARKVTSNPVFLNVDPHFFTDLHRSFRFCQFSSSVNTLKLWNASSVKPFRRNKEEWNFPPFLPLLLSPNLDQKGFLIKCLGQLNRRSKFFVTKNVLENSHLCNMDNNPSSNSRAMVIVRDLDWIKTDLAEDPDQSFHWREGDKLFWWLKPFFV